MEHQSLEDLNELQKAVAACNNQVDQRSIEMGGALSELKRKKAYKAQHYKKWSDYLDDVFSMGTSQAAKMIAMHDIYVRRLDMSLEDMLEIGLDKLTIIKPMLSDKNTPLAVSDEWLEKASEYSLADLKEMVKEAKEKDKKPTPLELFATQNTERMVTILGCNSQHLPQNYAFYFDGVPDEKIKAKVDASRRKFEEADAQDIGGNND